MNTIVFEEFGARLYSMNTAEIGDETDFYKKYNDLSLTRQNKIVSYYYEKDRRLSLGAGMLMDKGLAYYGLREADTCVAYGINEKPYLPDYPYIHFNLSHSENMVVAVFADVEIGCDIEQIQKANILFAKRFFCLSEYNYVLSQPTQRLQCEAFYRLWTLKESFLKAVGAGLSVSLYDFEILIKEDGIISVSQFVDNAEYSFRELRFGDYCVAVCFRNVAEH